LSVDPVLYPLLEWLALSVLTVWPLARICRRAGLPRRYALAVFVPLVGLLAVIAILSFTKWPNQPPAPPPRWRKERTV
jgi:hypothetical protein